jgi:hypothetical protein
MPKRTRAARARRCAAAGTRGQGGVGHLGPRPAWACSTDVGIMPRHATPCKCHACRRRRTGPHALGPHAAAAAAAGRRHCVGALMSSAIFPVQFWGTLPGLDLLKYDVSQVRLFSSANAHPVFRRRARPLPRRDHAPRRPPAPGLAPGSQEQPTVSGACRRFAEALPTRAPAPSWVGRAFWHACNPTSQPTACCAQRVRPSARPGPRWAGGRVPARRQGQHRCVPGIRLLPGAPCGRTATAFTMMPAPETRKLQSALVCSLHALRTQRLRATRCLRPTSTIGLRHRLGAGAAPHSSPTPSPT